MKVQKYNGELSRNRLKGPLSQILERSAANFDPDEISWIQSRLAITDMEGAREAYLSGCIVINVADELSGSIYDNIDIPLQGNAAELNQQIDEFADTVHDELTRDPKARIVVHCAMGMERAPLAVVGYLTKYHEMSIDEAYELIASKRPIACDRRLLMEEGMWAY